MKISKRTIQLLNNFSNIHQAINIPAGSSLMTTAPSSGKILANAEIVEQFPVDLRIYDIKKFLKAVAVFNNPDYEFTETGISISEDGQSLHYLWPTQYLTISTPPKLPPKNVLGSFLLTKETIDNINKVIPIVGADTIKYHSDGTNLYITVCRAKTQDANTYTIDLGLTPVQQEFNLLMDASLFLNTFIPGDYTVSITDDAAIIFDYDIDDLSYMVAVSRKFSTLPVKS